MTPLAAFILGALGAVSLVAPCTVAAWLVRHGRLRHRRSRTSDLPPLLDGPIVGLTWAEDRRALADRLLADYEVAVRQEGAYRALLADRPAGARLVEILRLHQAAQDRQKRFRSALTRELMRTRDRQVA